MQAPFVDPELAYLQTLPPLVGRSREMQLAYRVLHNVASDAPTGPRALTVSGAAGVGKTRLLAEVCAEAREQGFRVLEASAYEATSMYPYYPFIAALRPLIRTSSQKQLHRYLGLVQQGQEQRDEVITLTCDPLIAALARLFPELPARLPVKSQHELLTPEQEKFRLFDAIASLLDQVSQEQPLLLCVDNLHAADSASQELTLYLTVRLRASGVALIGASRPPYAASLYPTAAPTVVSPTAMRTAAKALNELVREGALLILSLEPLAREDALVHLQALLPGVISPALASTLLDWAGGNPFFLEELVRTLTLRRVIIQGQGEWVAAHALLADVPHESMAPLVEQRLAALSESCCDLLRVAALFGRSFPAAALAEVVRGEKGDERGRGIDALLDEAVRQGVIVPLEKSGESYRFCQGIVQEVLQAEVPRQRRRVLHGLIGKALERQYAGEAEEHAGELAHHYTLSEENESTLRWSLLAGREAAGKQAHREAIAHFQQALQVMERGYRPDIPDAGAIDAIQIRMAIGELWVRIGELEQATRTLLSALQEGQLTHSASPYIQARLNRTLADAYRMQGRYDQALSHLQAAYDALATGETSKGEALHVLWFSRRTIPAGTNASSESYLQTTERILLLQARATLDIMFNNARAAEEALWQSHRLATEVGDKNAQAFALQLNAWLCGWGERIHEAIRLEQQARQLYRDLGDPYRAALVDQVLGGTYQALGDVEQARLYTLRGLELARRYGVLGVLGWLYWNQAMLDLSQGDWENCSAHLQRAWQEVIDHENTRLKPKVLVGQAELAMRKGDWPEAERRFQDAIQAAQTTEWYPGTVALYGHFLAVTGRRAAARTYLDQAAALPEFAGIPGQFYIPFLAEGYLHIEEPEKATPYIERLRGLRGFMYYGNTTDRIMGLVSASVGDWDTAEQAFETGLLFCRRARNQPEEAAIYYEQARVALMRGESLQRIDELCAQARTLFLQYRMQRAVDMVDTLRQGAGQVLGQEREAREEVVESAHNGSPTTDGQHLSYATGEYTLDLHLTRRELEVLRLVAEGHTDREVADTLVISMRTANRHLSNILTKLTVPGRAAAVAFAVRHGLV